MRYEDFVSEQAWERYREERAYNRMLYKKQGWWCMAIVLLFVVVALIK